MSPEPGYGYRSQLYHLKAADSGQAVFKGVLEARETEIT